MHLGRRSRRAKRFTPLPATERRTAFRVPHAEFSRTGQMASQRDYRLEATSWPASLDHCHFYQSLSTAYLAERTSGPI